MSGQLLLLNENNAGIIVSLFSVIVLVRAVIDFKKIPLKRAGRWIFIIASGVSAVLGAYYVPVRGSLALILFFASDSVGDDIGRLKKMVFQKPDSIN